jgi:hypothetical protein
LNVVGLVVVEKMTLVQAGRTRGAYPIVSNLALKREPEWNKCKRIVDISDNAPAIGLPWVR